MMDEKEIIAMEEKMSYATIGDLKKMLEKAINEPKYHVIITIENEGQLEFFTYGQGISDYDVISMLAEKHGRTRNQANREAGAEK